MTDTPPRAPRRARWLATAGLGTSVTLGLLLGHPVRAETGSDALRPVVKGESTRPPADGDPWQYIELAVATEAPALAPLPAPGRVDLDEHRTSAVGSPLAGRVDEVRVRPGDRVKAGDRLFSVHSGAFADLEREVKSAETNVATRQHEADRVRELVRLQAAPEKDLLAAEAELRQAKLSLEAARARYASLSVSGEGDNLFWVTAPRAGTVVDLNVTSSQEVAPDRNAPLLRISELGEVLVLADVPETDAPDLSEGQRVTVTTRTGSVMREGTVERIGDVVDAQRRTVEVRIRVANEDRALRPNAFVVVKPTPPTNVKRVRVPADAVVTNGERSVVFVAREAGRLERVPVTVGRRRDGEVELRAGLEAGSRYVARGALLLENTLELAD